MVVHTGAKSQFGGLKNGFLRFINHGPFTSFAVIRPPSIPPTLGRIIMAAASRYC